MAHAVFHEIDEASFEKVIFAEDILTDSLKRILDPISGIGLAVRPLPNSLSVLHVVLPFSSVGLSIVPFKLPVAVALVRAEVSAVDSLMSHFQTEFLAVVLKSAFEEEILAEVDAESMSLVLFDALPEVQSSEALVGKHFEMFAIANARDFRVDGFVGPHELVDFLELFRQLDAKDVRSDALGEELTQNTDSFVCLHLAELGVFVKRRSLYDQRLRHRLLAGSDAHWVDGLEFAAVFLRGAPPTKWLESSVC